MMTVQNVFFIAVFKDFDWITLPSIGLHISGQTFDLSRTLQGTILKSVKR
jgi:hypothetical protein